MLRIYCTLQHVQDHGITTTTLGQLQHHSETWKTSNPPLHCRLDNACFAWVQDMRAECTSLSGFSWPWWIQRKRFGVFAPSLSLNCKQTGRHMWVIIIPNKIRNVCLGFIVSGYGIFCIFVVVIYLHLPVVLLGPRQVADMEWCQVTTNTKVSFGSFLQKNFQVIQSDPFNG